MISIQSILNQIEPLLKTLTSEPINLHDALGRVLADDIHSRAVIPPYDIANIDGYAIDATNIDSFPITFNKSGKSTPHKIFTDTVKPHHYVQVFSGSLIPKGTNAIVPIKSAEIYKNSIIVNDHVMEGDNISVAGIDIADGDIILKKGTILTSRHIALANITEIPWIPVIRSPKIGIISNLDTDYNNVEFNHIQKKNGDAIKSFLSSFISARGGRPTTLGAALSMQAPVKQIPAFKAELKEALESVDLLTIVGGIDLGIENLLWSSLIQDGAVLEIYKIAIGSGEEIIIGNRNNVPIIGLPNHNVASLICALLFLKPCIDKLLGINNNHNVKIYATLDRDLDEFDKATDYLYAKLYENKNGDQIVSPISAQDSLMISVLTNTNCIIVINPSTPLTSGSTVEVIMVTGSIVST